MIELDPIPPPARARGARARLRGPRAASYMIYHSWLLPSAGRTPRGCPQLRARGGKDSNRPLVCTRSWQEMAAAQPEPEPELEPVHVLGHSDQESSSGESDVSFEFEFETDSDEEMKGEAMSGASPTLTLKMVLAQHAQARAAAARKAGQERAEHATASGLVERQVRRCSRAVVLSAAVDGTQEKVASYFGYRAVSMQRLAFCKLLNDRLASGMPDGMADMPEDVISAVGRAVGSEKMLSRMLTEFGPDRTSSLGRWLGSGGEYDRDTHAKCLMLAMRSAQVAVCRLLLRLQLSIDVTAAIRPSVGSGADGDAGLGSAASMVKWESDEGGVSCLDVARRCAPLPAQQILRDMWEACPPQDLWAAVAWRRALHSLSSSDWLDEAQAELIRLIPVRDGDTRCPSSALIECISRTGEPLCRGKEIHPAVLEWWEAQPSEVFSSFCPFKILRDDHSCPMEHRMHGCIFARGGKVQPSHTVPQRSRYDPERCGRQACVYCRVAAIVAPSPRVPHRFEDRSLCDQSVFGQRLALMESLAAEIRLSHSGQQQRWNWACYDSY